MDNHAVRNGIGHDVNPSDPQDGADRLFEGVPYAYGAVAPAGAVLFTAGACPLDHDGTVLHPGDPVGQARVALDNLHAALRLHGAAFSHLVKTTIYVVGGHDELVGVWDVVAGGLAPHRPPSTLLGVSVLGYTGQLVEIEGIAALPH